MKLVARHYKTGTALQLTIEKSRIAEIKPLTDSSPDLPWIAPGLVDLQINGFGGIDLNRPLPDQESWRHLCQQLFAHGCTHFLATLITHSQGEYRELLAPLEKYRSTYSLNCVGYHFEGPFLNPNPGTRGAHSSEQMIPCNIPLLEEWIHLTHQQVKMITLAPEVDWNSSEIFIREATTRGIRISLGHSSASASILQKALQAGASAWTHLGNAVANPMPKWENVIFSVLAEESLPAFLIPDGLHVPNPAFKVLARHLGIERLLLTTDAMAGAGQTTGDYTLGKAAVRLSDDGSARLPETGRLAGSTLTPFAGVFRAAELSGLAWPEMWDAFSIHPARWLGLDHALEEGRDANFCLFHTEPSLRLENVFHQGINVFMS